MLNAKKKSVVKQCKLDDYRLSKYEKVIMFYRENPVEAVRDICMREPTWFQRIIIRGLWTKLYCLLKCGRGSSKCLRHNELIYLSDKGTFVKIQSVRGQKIKVLAMDENYKLVEASASVEDNGIDECFKIKLRSGRSIEVTGEHPLYTIDGWVEAKNLKRNDRVAVARNMPHITKDSVGMAKSRLLGYLIGDGGITKSIIFTNNDISILDDFKTIVSDAFPNTICKICNSKDRAISLRVSGILNDGSRFRNDLLIWLREMDLFGKNSFNKYVPNCVYSWSKEDISNFIGAYFDCDGTINNDSTISMSSVSEELLKGVQRLLLKFDILSSIKRINTSWIYKKEKKRSHAFVLYIYGHENILKFVKEIKSVSNKFNRLNLSEVKSNPNVDTIPKKIWNIYESKYGIKLRSRKCSRSYRKRYSSSRDKLEKFGNEFGIEDAINLSKSDIFWDEVTSISNTGLHQTYAVEVPKHHNFLADTVITHNTSTTAWYLVLKAILYPRMRIGVIAPSYRQTQYVFDEIDEIYNDSPFIRAATRKAPTRSTDRSIMIFHNGSFIEGLPVGVQGAKIRGRRYDIIALDEYAQMDEDTIRLVIRPMLAIKRFGRENQIIRSSSPFFKFNHFYDSYIRHKELAISDPEHYHCSSFNFIDILLDKNKNFQPDLRMVIEAYREDPEDLFMMEWLGIYPDETSTFFPFRLIDSCVPRGVRELVPIENTGVTGYDYIMGIDVARAEQGDLFVMSILKLFKNGSRQLVKMVSGRGKKFQEMAEMIRKEIYLNNFNVISIYMDSRGGGKELQDLIGEPWVHDGKVYPSIIQQDDVALITSTMNRDSKVNNILKMVDFNTTVINDMYFKLKSDMEQGNILFPMDLRRSEDLDLEAIGKEISSFKKELAVIQATPGQHGLKFETPRKFSKDRITATVLANYSANALAKNMTDHTEEETIAFQNMLEAGRWA